MKVLHILDERWDSALTAYGISLAAAFRDGGDVVSVAAREGSPAMKAAQARRLHVLPLSSVWALRKLVGSAGFDVVNAHTGSGHFAGFCAVLGRNVALVRTRGDARPLGRRWGQAQIYSRADGVVAASRHIEAEYRDVFPELTDRLSVIYPGMDVPVYAPEPAEPLRVALVGRWDPVKGHGDFLEAIRLIKDDLDREEFLIVGEEKNISRRDLDGLVDHLGVKPWVKFLGWQKDMPAFMRSCHVGVIASVGSEALSRVALEWMSSGRPVVATAVGCLPELVSTGETGFLIPSKNPAAMADCLRGLLRQPALRQSLGKRAREVALERFGWARFREDTLRVYEKALSLRHAHRPS